MAPLAPRSRNIASKYDDESTAEGWVWSRIRHNEVADLNLRCDPTGKTILEAGKEDGWDNDCRKIHSTFIVEVLTEPELRKQIKPHGLHLKGARIEGVLKLTNIEIASEIWIEASRIDGNVELQDTRSARFLSIDYTQLSGDFDAFTLHVASGLSYDCHHLQGQCGLIPCNSRRVGSDERLHL